jgi:hypothetical protein
MDNTNNIIDFSTKAKSNIIKYDRIISQDSYLMLTTINALDKYGYETSPKGVKEFQEDSGIEATGIVNVETFCLLCIVFDNDIQQDLYHRLDIAKNKCIDENKNKKKDKSSISAIIWTILFLYFEICGIIFTVMMIYNLIKHLL